MTRKRYPARRKGGGYSAKRVTVPIGHTPVPHWIKQRDARRAEVRWYLEKARSIAIDRGGGKNLSTITKNQIEQFVRVAVRCEVHWHRLEQSPNADDTPFLNAVRTLSRLAVLIGLDRVSTPTHTLQTFLESRAEAPASAEA
jgi:hypothetical protein